LGEIGIKWYKLVDRHTDKNERQSAEATTVRQSKGARTGMAALELKDAIFAVRGVMEDLGWPKSQPAKKLVEEQIFLLYVNGFRLVPPRTEERPYASVSSGEITSAENSPAAAF